MIDKTIGAIVREMEDNDNRGNTQISEYVSFNLRETIETIDAYLNSKHTSGETDSQGREKPFFNIVTSAVNIYYRATDIDRKNITVTATREGNVVAAFLATLKLQEWMRKNNFGMFLNEWGRVLARYGSAVVKFIEKGGELSASNIPWDTIICDPIDFENNVVIEKLWLTPAQLLKNKNYDKELVDKLLDATTTRKTSDGLSKDTKSDYIPIYEVHGEMPLSLLTGKDSDDDTFVQQMHVITYLASKDKSDGYTDFTLYAGREAKNPYMITHLIKEDGRTLAIGAVEHLFQAQWMVNHSAKQIKDQLDLASKIIFQTSDGNFVNQNALTNIENGDLLVTAVNQPITMLNNKPDIVAMQSNQSQWQNLGSQINGISESMQGINAPSGTAWRQVQALLQESHSLFELMTENKGLALTEMLTTYVIPNLKKKLDTTDEISELLTEQQIKWIDSRFIPNQTIKNVNEIKKNTILSGQVYDPAQEPMDMQAEMNKLQQNLGGQGNQRFIKPSEIDSKTWKEALRNIEWNLDIDITGEAKDRQGALATLTTVLQTLATNPAMLNDPNMRLIFNRILELSATVSPLEMAQSTPVQAPVQSPMPQVPAEAMPQPTM